MGVKFDTEEGCQISPPSVQRQGYRTHETEIFTNAIFVKFAEFVPRFRMR